MGEDWGKNNLAKAYVAMKNFQMLPLDTTITNTENALNMQHFQVMNLEQTNRMLSRVQLANYFKGQAFEVVGVTPQRLGQQIGQTETATGIEQAVSGSYAQTEMYFIQHSDYLMPRVHQMRTDLAQYYQSTKPSLRLQYITSADEKVNFEINGTELLLRDINVYCTTKANHRAIIEQMKKLAINNNTSGASIYDLGTIMQADSMGELDHVLKQTEAKANAIRQEDSVQQQQIQKAQIEAALKEKQMQLDHDTIEKEKDRRRDILVAEIKSAGFGAMQDIDKNAQSDYLDALGQIQQTEQFQETMNLDRTKEQNNALNKSQKLQVDKDKISAQLQMKQMDVQIAKENKNKFDKKPAPKKKK